MRIRRCTLSCQVCPTVIAPSQCCSPSTLQREKKAVRKPNTFIYFGRGRLDSDPCGNRTEDRCGTKRISLAAFTCSRAPLLKGTECACAIFFFSSRRRHTR